MALPTPPVRKMRADKFPKFCYWEEMTTTSPAPVISKKNPEKKGDYILICDCDRCREVPLRK